METGHIVQLSVKFAINVDMKTTFKMFVAGFLSSEGRSKSRSQKQVNELRQDRQGSTSMSSSGKFVSDNSKTVPKQVVDIVDVINQNQSSGKNLRRSLELDTLSTTSWTAQVSEGRTECSTEHKTDNTSATQILSNIDMNGVIIRGKQNTGAEINAMPLNIYDQLNQS